MRLAVHARRLHGAQQTITNPRSLLVIGAHGKNLTVIYIPHGYGGHSLGQPGDAQPRLPREPRP